MNAFPQSHHLLPGAVEPMQAHDLREVTLGVLGGGQLGRMFAHAAQQMGFATAVLDPDLASPAGRVSHHHVATDYLDENGLERLARVCQAVTVEFENVPAQALDVLAGKCFVSPGAQAVGVAQDRILEKAHFTHCGVPVAPYAVIKSSADVAKVESTLFPGILKTARMGYDGKGQRAVESKEALAAVYDQLGQVPCILEKKLPLLSECSVIVARGVDGLMVNLPVQVNEHRGGILAFSHVYEQNLPSELAASVIDATKKIALGLNYVGVLCVEFFIVGASDTTASQWVVNEMAPRPHNSGHYSMDACDLSQFHLQARTLAGLPLVQPRLHSSAIMINLLGDLWFVNSEQATVPAWDKVLALPGTHLHLYGKTKAVKGRKMGHLNVTAASPQRVREVALQACAILGIAPF